MMQDKDREMWAAVEADYLSGQMSVRDVARKHGVSESRIYKRATKYGWKSKQAKIRKKADDIVITRHARARAKEMEVMCSATARMSRLLDKTVEAMEGMPSEVVCQELKGLSSLATAIKANVDALMLLHRVQTPAQEEAQKIARARLKLEERRQQWEESKAAQGTGAQQVEVTIRREEVEDDEQIDEIIRLCTAPDEQA